MTGLIGQMNKDSHSLVEIFRLGNTSYECRRRWHTTETGIFSYKWIKKLAWTNTSLRQSCLSASWERSHRGLQTKTTSFLLCAGEKLIESQAFQVRFKRAFICLILTNSGCDVCPLNSLKSPKQICRSRNVIVDLELPGRSETESLPMLTFWRVGIPISLAGDSVAARHRATLGG
jgi:hypothetical protein